MNTLETSTSGVGQKKEGKTTAMIEAKTSRVPSGAYLSLAIGSMIGSAAAMIAGKKQLANFIGQWVPSLLIIGLYNKVVKLEDELLCQREGRFGGEQERFGGEQERFGEQGNFGAQGRFGTNP